MVLASGTTHSASLLSVFALGVLLWLDRERGKAAIRRAVVAVVIIVPALTAFGWYTGEWLEWQRQFEWEYWKDLVEPSRRVAGLPLFRQFLLLTGALPLAVPFARAQLSLAGRVLFLTGLAYLVIVLAGSYKNLHYLMPLPWIFLAPAIEATAPALRVAATVVLACVLALSWPNDRTIRREAINLGTETCIQGLDYEAAALAAGGVYQALDWPASGKRFGVGKHPFVRYGLELGGTDCVVGYSRIAPPDAVRLIDGPPAIWTTDPDRYARWRLRSQVPMPSSVLFPRPPQLAYSANPAAWADPVNVTQEPGRSLLIEGFGAAEGGTVPLTGSARLLIPWTGVGQRDVTLRLQAGEAVRLRVVVKGVPVPDLIVEPGSREIVVAGDWRPGWNLLELDGAAGMRLEWLDGR